MAISEFPGNSFFTLKQNSLTFFFKVKLALKQSLFKKQTFLQCSTKAQKFDTCMQEMTVGKYEVRKLHIQCELCNS